MPFYYYVYGLRVRSWLEMPELAHPTGDGDFDVDIRLEHNIEPFQKIRKQKNHYAYCDGECLLDIEGVAGFRIVQGKVIFITTYPETQLEDVRLYLLGTCFGVVLHHRQTLALHASSIIHEGKAVLFAGLSGAGKSTTANSFRLRGHNMLNDDISVVNFIDGIPYAMPGYPQSKLWSESIRKLHIDPSSLSRVMKGIDKLKVPIKDHFQKTPTPIKAIYVLSVNSKATQVSKLSLHGADKFLAIKNQTYRNRLLDKIGNVQYRMKVIQELACQVHVCRLSRPVSDSITTIPTLIERDIKELESSRF